MKDELRKIEMKDDGKRPDRFHGLAAKIVNPSKKDVLKQETKAKSQKKAKKS